ncbi:PepSY domain-containing protein [Actinoplanes sp. NPDC026623]|uniref:PepSY domain-containing protein n=1 Tax=Actinoplanes sp. NPDC026623 TaxID=3155610 RepID=UPI0033E7C666
MIKLRPVSTLALGVTAALALGGTALAAGADDPAPARSSDDRGGAVPMLPNGDPVPTGSADDDFSTPAPAPATTGAASPAAVDIDAARAIALGVAGGGRVTGIEAETEHGRAVWDIDVVTNGVRHDIDVDRATGAVLRHRTKGSDRVKTRSSDDNGTDDRRDHGTDDHGTDDNGTDDNGTDDHGQGGGHGADDNGADDHGRHGGHGSDD